jgi:hypothetical protein
MKNKCIYSAIIILISNQNEKVKMGPNFHIWGATKLSITAFNITTLSIMMFNIAIRKYDIQRDGTQHKDFMLILSVIVQTVFYAE